MRAGRSEKSNFTKLGTIGIAISISISTYAIALHKAIETSILVVITGFDKTLLGLNEFFFFTASLVIIIPLYNINF